MNQKEAVDALFAKLETLVTSPSLPFVYENQEFKPETGGGENGWLYSEIQFASGVQASIGAASNFIRNSGTMVVNVVVPRGDRAGRALGIGQDIMTLFKAESISGLHISNRWIGNGRLSAQDSRWYALPVIMEFWTDHLETPA